MTLTTLTHSVILSSVKEREEGVDDNDDDGHDTAGPPVESEYYYGCDSTLRSAGVPRLTLTDYFCDETPASRSPVPSSSPRANDGTSSIVLFSAIVDDSSDNNDNAAPHALLTRGVSRKLSADYYDLTHSGKPNLDLDANPLADFSLELLQQSGKYIPPGVQQQQSTIGHARQGQRQGHYPSDPPASSGDDVNEFQVYSPSPADAVMYQGLAEQEVFHGHCTEEGRSVLLAMLSRPQVGRRLTSSQWTQCLTK